MPTLLDPDHVATLMSPGIDGDDLLLVIEREEDVARRPPGRRDRQLLASGPTDLGHHGDDRPLLLRRPTAAVDVVDGGVALAADEVHLLRGTRIERDGAWRGPTVDVTSTPSDQLAVERVLLELVRLTLSASPSPRSRWTVTATRARRPGGDPRAPRPLAVAPPKARRHGLRPASTADG